MQQGHLQKISHLLHACLSLYTLYKHKQSFSPSLVQWTVIMLLILSCSATVTLTFLGFEWLLEFLPGFWSRHQSPNYDFFEAFQMVGMVMQWLALALPSKKVLGLNLLESWCLSVWSCVSSLYLHWFLSTIQRQWSFHSCSSAAHLLLCCVIV